MGARVAARGRGGVSLGDRPRVLSKALIEPVWPRPLPALRNGHRGRREHTRTCRDWAVVADADHPVASRDLRSRGTADAIDKALGEGRFGKAYGAGGEPIPIEAIGDAVRAVLG